MSKFSKRMREKYKKSNKKSIAIYFILRIFVIISMIAQIVLGNFGNAVMCVIVLILFTVPTFIEDKLKIEFPSALEGLVYIFIFSSSILGTVNDFYRLIPIWDTILHTLNGFICAGIGFSLVDILNNNSSRFKLSPLYVAIVAFCFSMTIGVLWEFYEFSSDYLRRTDMQRDRIVKCISSIELNEGGKSIPVKVDNIEKTEIYSKDGKITTIEGGYLDIGIRDTMKDLLVNLIGAIIFSVIGFLYVSNRDKYKFVGNFIPKKEENYYESNGNI